MNKKRYTTKQQRELLQSAGVGHIKGRTYEQGEALIKQCIQDGRLPRNALSPPTENQLNFLERHDVQHASDITKEEASEIVQAKKDEIAKGRPITDRQYDFIYELGGVPKRRMSQYQASRFIEYLYLHGTKCEKCGGNNDRRSARCPQCGAFLATMPPIRPPKDIYEPEGFLECLLDLFGL